MNRRIGLMALAAVLLVSPALAADEKAREAKGQPEMTPEMQAEMQAYMKAGTPGPEHKKMAEAVGEYTLAIKSWHEPNGPAMESTGTAKRSTIFDGRVLVEEVDASMMEDMRFQGHGMMGFDNVSGKHWHTWLDSMSTGIMISEGTCDAQGVCQFAGSWNDPIKKGPIKARMTSRWTSPTVQVFEMYAPGRDGKEMKMMEITYTKKS